MGKSQRSLQITIDHQTHCVGSGSTILDVARKAGIPIPTLCHLDDCKPPASCMVCLVKDVKTGANLPACATEVVDGMELDSETDEVHALRRTALELLLSDHVGDCLGPCTLACPLHADIPSVVRLIRENRLREAAQLLRHQLPLPTLLERLCTKPCEKACRRGQYDQSVAITTLHETILPENEASVTDTASVDSSIAIVGTGMTGLSAAHFLRNLGYSVTTFEKTDQPGGRLREEMVLAGLPEAMLHEELKRLEHRGVTFQLRTPVDPEILDKLLDQFDAVLVASGSEAKNLFGESLQNPACFIAGDALKPDMPILRRAVSGRDAAVAVEHFLTDNAGTKRRITPAAANRSFSVRLGKLNEAEMNLFVEEVAGIDANDMPEGLGEAARCFLCDCTDLADCKLRQLAIEYGADPRRYKVPRRELVRQRTPSGIAFESGKCIRCGRCIEILKKDPGAAGLTFVGRGFDVILSTPFGQTLDEALGRMADACCEACPTGALVSSALRSVKNKK